jgi:hypothetical protein
MCYICGWYGSLCRSIVLVLCILVDRVDFGALLADYVVSLLMYVRVQQDAEIQYNLFNIYFNVILPSTSRSSQWSLQVFLQKLCMHFFSLPCVLCTELLNLIQNCTKLLEVTYDKRQLERQDISIMRSFALFCPDIMYEDEDT